MYNIIKYYFLYIFKPVIYNIYTILWICSYFYILGFFLIKIKSLLL